MLLSVETEAQRGEATFLSHPAKSDEHGKSLHLLVPNSLLLSNTHSPLPLIGP